MQAIRTAGQKTLSGHLNAMGTTLVRFLFGLPFVWLYLAFMAAQQPSEPPIQSLINSSFIQSAVLASLAQILGTAFVIMAFRYQNFAVATSLVKTEAVLTAIVSVIAFDAVLSGLGWFSVIVGVFGVLVLSKAERNLKNLLSSPASLFGILAGLGFALATLWIREASLTLNTNPLFAASITLACMVSLQTGLVAIYVLFQDKHQFIKIAKQWKLSLFVGLTSMLGSVGWFTAASLQEAAYVKALGQVEFFFTLVITLKLFKEQIALRDYIGMLLIILSVIVLILWA